MPAPIIGVTVSRFTSAQGIPRQGVAEAYISALIQAGASPVMIPLSLPEGSLAGLTSLLDGVLFTGGGDIQPQRYGSQPHPLVGDVDHDRDRVEMRLFHDTLSAGLPFLGICRGIQLVNVALGGTLYEDILEQRPHAQRHQYAQEYPRDYLAHPVLLDGDSGLASIYSTQTLEVNSLHHQGIDRLAPRLRTAGFAPDGLIEAVELPGYPFGFAVQWHPESLPDRPESHTLFRAFVQAAETRKEQASQPGPGRA